MSAIRQILSIQMLKNDHAKLHADATGELEHLEIHAARAEKYKKALENIVKGNYDNAHEINAARAYAARELK